MCFAPQQRALFQHLNFQKCSEHDVFCAFWLGNVLRATTACTFSTSQLPKVLRTWCVLCILTWKCASRHNGMHFFDIATSKSAPNVLFFLAFSLANVLRATTGWTFSTSQLRKALQTWSVFSFFTCIYASRHKRACNFSWPNGSVPAAWASPLFDPPEPQIIGKTQCFATFLPFHAPGSYFFRDFLFFDLLSSSLLFSDSSHLCFSSVHIVGSLTSKLPSANILFIYQLEKWLQSFGRPEQSLRYKIPFNNQINNRPCRIAPKKNLIEQICVVYPRSNRTLSVGIPLCVKFFLWNHFLWLYCHSVGEGNIEITLGDMSRHDMFSSFQILHYARLCSRAQSPLLLLSVYLPYLSIYLPNLIYLIYLKNLI